MDIDSDANTDSLPCPFHFQPLYEYAQPIGCLTNHSSPFLNQLFISYIDRFSMNTKQASSSIEVNVRLTFRSDTSPWTYEHGQIV